MKKFLEVLIDDAGTMHFSTDCDYVKSSEPANRNRVSSMLDEAAIRSLVKQFWEKQAPCLL